MHQRVLLSEEVLKRCKNYFHDLLNSNGEQEPYITEVEASDIENRNRIQ